MAAPTRADAWTRSGNPMALFRVTRPVHVDGGSSTVTEMAVGPWLTDATGRPTPAALGVLLDEALGYSVFAARPADTVSVTSELGVDLAHEVPPDATRLVARTDVVAVHPDCGMAACRVETDTGVLVALGTTWCRFLPAAGARVDETYFADGPVPDDDVRAPALLGTDPAAGVLQPVGSHANGLGNVHGGIVLGAATLAGRAALPATATTTSVRTSYLRPTLLTGPVDLAVEVVRAGRTVGVARVATVGADGRTTTVSTVTGRA
ncbi:hypothetical protein GCM10027047_26120 [Rhodococcus aerolatus]